MRKNKKLFILFLLVLISIGFAYLTTTLEINGIAGIGRNNWNIYFDNVVHLTGENLATTKPTTTGTNTKKLTYRINLNKPGDAYRFNVDIVNSGTLDAMITLINNTSLTSEQAKYIDYSVTYADGTELANKNLLAKSTRDKLLVSVIYKDNVSNDDLLANDIEVDIDLTIKYEQADSTAQARSTGQLNVKFDYNYNLIGDFEDYDFSNSAGKISIKNNVIKLEAGRNDYYYHLNTPCFYLEENKTYYIESEIDGTWGTAQETNTQEFWVMKTGGYDIAPYYHITSNSDYFKVLESHDYRLRFDCNMNGETCSFWNLFLTEYLESSFNVGANITLPTEPIRDGYTFDGWYTERVGGTKITTSTKVNYSTTYYAHWLEA